MAGSTIKTNCIAFGEKWVAWFKGQKNDQNAPRGYGTTERDAIIALFDEAWARIHRRPQVEPTPLASGEIMVLRLLCGEIPGFVWGAWVGVCLESLAGRGYATSGPHYMPTDAGRAALANIDAKVGA